jgi:hypothetical protein
VSDSEFEALKKITETKVVDQLIATVTAHKIVTSVDELVKLHPSDLLHANNMTWTMPLILATSSFLVAMLLYYCVHTHLAALTCCSHKDSQDVRIPCTQNSPSQETIPPSVSRSPFYFQCRTAPAKVMRRTQFNSSNTLKKFAKKIYGKTHRWCCVKSCVI